MTPKPVARSGVRRWFQFRLRTLCLAFLLVSILLGLVGTKVHRHYRRQSALRFITELGGVVLPDRKAGATRVYLAGPRITDSVLVEVVRHLQFITEMRELDLVSTAISDAALLKLAQLPQLEVLFVHDCAVTDEGVQKLQLVAPNLVVNRNAPDPIATRLAMRKIFRQAVVAVAVSPDRREIITGSGDGTLRKWRDVSTFGDTIQAHDNWLFSAAYSPDGKIIATGGGDGRIRLWNSQSLTMVAELVGHTDDVHSVSFAANGKTLVSAGDDRTVRIWDIAAGRESYVLSGHTAAIPAIKVLNRLGLIASGSRDHTIRLWSLESGELLHELRGHTADINALALDESETQLASASYDGTVSIWDLRDGKEVRQLIGHTSRVYSVAFLNELAPGRLVSAGADSTIRIWNVQSGAIERVIRTPRLVAALSAMPSWRLIVATTAEGTLDAWSPLHGQLVSSHWTWIPNNLGLAVHQH